MSSQSPAYPTPQWDEQSLHLKNLFAKAHPGFHPFELFDVSVVSDNGTYYLSETQAGSLLVSLHAMLGDAFDTLSPGESMELPLDLLGAHAFLGRFHEHGTNKHQNPQDETCHPFLHAVLSAGKTTDGALKAMRISPRCLEGIIEEAFEHRADFSPNDTPSDVRNAVNRALNLLDSGKARVAEKIKGVWIVNQWLKKAVLLSFRINENRVMDGGNTLYYDKVESKFAQYSAEDFARLGARIVPNAVVRHGSYIAPGAILMPSFVNIGAYVGEGTMVDTWATVGSCAQIGKNVHLSGGVGIGGVLEPLQAGPTIIEDNCFIGARSEIVEGVVVEEGSVISMGVYIGQGTKIYNRMTGEITYGRIPAGSVVVPGSLPVRSSHPPFEITHNLSCAVIIKQVDAQTRSKTGINELLRD